MELVYLSIAAWVVLRSIARRGDDIALATMRQELALLKAEIELHNQKIAILRAELDALRHGGGTSGSQQGRATQRSTTWGRNGAEH